MYQLGRLTVAATLLIQTVAAGASPPSEQTVGGSNAGRVVIDDPLASGLPEMTTPCRGIHGDGGYILSSNVPNRFCNITLVRAGAFQFPARLELTIRLRQGAPDALFGLSFGQGPNHNDPHVFVINGNGTFRMARHDGKVWEDIVRPTTDAAIRTGLGATNRLAVEIRGQSIRGFINGQSVLNAQTSATLPASFGAFLDTSGLESVLTDLRVTALAPPTTATYTSGGTVWLDDDLQTEQKHAIGRSEFCDKAYTDGGYRVENVHDGMCQANLMRLSDAPFHARLEVTARLLSGDAGGLFGIRVGATGTAPVNHFFGVSSNGELFLGVRQKDWTELVPRAVVAAVRRSVGASNRLALEIDGRRLRAFVNTSFVGEATSPVDVTGWIGLVVEATGARVVFTNLRIVDLAVPTKAATERASTRPLESTTPRQESDTGTMRSAGRSTPAATGGSIRQK